MGLLWEAAVIDPFPPGDYWADGVVALAPLVGNYTPTTKHSDGVSGDTTTRETATGLPGLNITILKKLASPISIATWAWTAKWTGLEATVFSYWNGSAFVAMVDTSSASSFHLAYIDEQHTSTFISVPSASIFRCVLTESDGSGGNNSVSDSRVA